MAADKERDPGQASAEIGKYTDILAKDPNSRVFAPLAEAYRKSGLLDEAIATALEGLKVHPNYLGGRVALGRAYFEKKQYAEAAAELQKVVKSAPDNLIAHKILGQIAYGQGDLPGALKAFKMVLMLDPRDQEAQQLVTNISGGGPSQPPPDLRPPVPAPKPPSRPAPAPAPPAPQARPAPPPPTAPPPRQAAPPVSPAPPPSRTAPQPVPPPAAALPPPVMEEFALPEEPQEFALEAPALPESPPFAVDDLVPPITFEEVPPLQPPSSFLDLPGEPAVGFAVEAPFELSSVEPALPSAEKPVVELPPQETALGDETSPFEVFGRPKRGGPPPSTKGEQEAFGEIDLSAQVAEPVESLPEPESDSPFEVFTRSPGPRTPPPPRPSRGEGAGPRELEVETTAFAPPEDFSLGNEPPPLASLDEELSPAAVPATTPEPEVPAPVDEELPMLDLGEDVPYPGDAAPSLPETASPADEALPLVDLGDDLPGFDLAQEVELDSSPEPGDSFGTGEAVGEQIPAAEFELGTEVELGPELEPELEPLPEPATEPPAAEFELEPLADHESALVPPTDDLLPQEAPPLELQDDLDHGAPGDAAYQTQPQFDGGEPAGAQDGGVGESFLPEPALLQEPTDGVSAGSAPEESPWAETVAEPQAVDEIQPPGGALEMAGDGEFDDYGEEEAPAADQAGRGVFDTETLATIYIDQGFYGRAAEIYQRLIAQRPGDNDLQRKLEEVQALEREKSGVGESGIAVPETAADEPLAAFGQAPVFEQAVAFEEPPLFEEPAAPQQPALPPGPFAEPAAAPVSVGVDPRIDMLMALLEAFRRGRPR